MLQLEVRNTIAFFIYLDRIEQCSNLFMKESCEVPVSIVLRVKVVLVASAVMSVGVVGSGTNKWKHHCKRNFSLHDLLGRILVQIDFNTTK